MRGYSPRPILEGVAILAVMAAMLIAASLGPSPNHDPASPDLRVAWSAQP